MTLDEAIKHNIDMAERYERFEDSHDEKLKEECLKCTEEYRQLAEWLTELKEAKRLLKSAVEDIYYYVDCDCYEVRCDECCCDHNNHCHWKHEAEALALIGGEEQ